MRKAILGAAMLLSSFLPGAFTASALAAQQRRPANHWYSCTIPVKHGIPHWHHRRCNVYAMPRHHETVSGWWITRERKPLLIDSTRYPRFRVVPKPAFHEAAQSSVQSALPGCPPAIAQWAEPIEIASRTYGIPVSELTGIVSIESEGNAAAYNPASGASGLMQILPSNFASLGLYAPFDGYANIQAGALLLSRMGEDVDAYSGGGYSVAYAYARGCD